MEAYRRYGPALLRKCRRLLHNGHDPEDIVQGLFLDLWQRGITDPDLPYLYRAATNRCLNLLRDRQTRARLLSEHDPSLQGPLRSSLEQQVLDIDLLYRTLARLDPSSAEVLIYRHLDDMGIEQIGELLGTSRKTVARRLKQAEDTLRSLCDGGSP